MIRGSDLFTDTNWKLLTSHTANQGGPWVKHPTYAGNWYVYGNRTLCRTAGINYLTAPPASADYSVQADMRVFSDISETGIAGRISTGASTYYFLRARFANELVLGKSESGTVNWIDDYSATGLWAAGSTYTLKLEMIGTAIKGYVDGVELVSAVDASITAAGKGGLYAKSVSDWSTGKHLDNFSIYDAAAAATPRSSVVGLIGL